MGAVLKIVRSPEARAARRAQWARDMADPVEGPRLRALAAAGEKRWRERHPEQNAARQREWQEKRRLEVAYGLSRAGYERLLVAQNGVCAICRQPETRLQRSKPMRLSVDHDHDTGTVRGLLCCMCNRGIGLFHDTPLHLRAAADYLERAR